MSAAAIRQRQAFVVVDLGYGDAGKGTVIDFLTRLHRPHTIVRFNGGAQAAHNVVTPDGRHHTFTQFGSGLFVPGVRTYLSRFMLIEPYAMFNEEQHLRELGVLDAFARTLLDRRALVITPYQQAANRLREMARGDARHGSCGVGIGETMADYLKHGDDVLFAGDLPHRARVARKLRFLRAAKYSEIQSILPQVRGLAAAQAALRVFDDSGLIEIAAENYEYLARCVQLVDESALRAILDQPGVVLFEGAQGVLLDETYGFTPYTTWSTTTTANAIELLRTHDYAGRVLRLGVLRTYFTRHGAGPFVTEAPELAAALPEAHNETSPWQQHFRVGHLDLVAARYALAVTGGVDALAITHLDRLPDLPAVGLCHAYHFDGPAAALDGFFRHDGPLITGINVSRPASLLFQEQLTSRLLRCAPVYQPTVDDPDQQVTGSAAERHLAAIEQALEVPIWLTSDGPTAHDKHTRFAIAPAGA